MARNGHTKHDNGDAKAWLKAERADAIKRTKYVRMKHVTRVHYGWIVKAGWGPEKLALSFADSKWEGPLGALMAANCAAADIHLGWDKPITSRIVMYPFWRTPESTNERGIFKLNSGRLIIRVSPHPKKHKTVTLPPDTPLEEAIRMRNELQHAIYEAYPIRYYQG